MIKIIDRYIFKEILGPFVYALVLLTMVLLLNRLLRMMDMIITKGLDVWIVLEIILLSLPFMFAVTVPMSVLVAMVVSFGRLSGDNEIVSLKASGVSLYRLVVPGLVFSFFVFLGMVYFNNNILPNTNHRLKNLLIDIQQKSPMLDFKEGVFTKFENDYEILIKSKEEKKPIAYGIIIYEPKDNGPPTTITAERAEMAYLDNGNRLKITLFDGEVHEIDERDPKGYKRIVFKQHIINLKSSANLHRSTNAQRGDREMSAQDMLMLINGWKQSISDSKLAILIDVENRLRFLLDEDERIIQRIEASEAMLLPYPYIDINMDTLNMSNKINKKKPDEENPQKNTPFQIFSNDQQFSARVNSFADDIRRFESEISKYMVEVHKKYSIPFACLAFVILGIPLGIMSRGGGIGIGIGLSMGFFVIYWIFLMTGERLADRMLVTPFWSMWAANILIGVLGFYLTVRNSRETSMIDWSSISTKLNPFKRRISEAINIPTEKEEEGKPDQQELNTIKEDPKL